MSPAPSTRWTLSTQAALLALVAVALLAGVVPAGMMLETWLARELEGRVRADLVVAPRLLAERNAAVGDAMMMHAKELAHEPALAAALARGDREGAARAADAATRPLAYRAIVVDAEGQSVEGARPPAALLDATRAGKMPVSVVGDRSALYMMSIAPVEEGGRWLGAAGVATPLDDAAAAALAGLTRSDRVILVGDSGAVAASPGDSTVVAALARGATAARADAPPGGEPIVREVSAGGRRFLVTSASLGNGTVLFARDLGIALALLPRLRWMLAASGAGALLLALLLGSLLAAGIARPVRALAGAAGRLSRGDFDAPLERSRIRELARVTGAFHEMRAALAAHIQELRAANRTLEDRQARLTALQAELIRRERAAVSSRMVAELAHEIRNPIANVRNCLELIERRARGDAESRDFAALAIDELLRMHELAERMLDLNRPRPSGAAACDVVAVLGEVAALARLGIEATGGAILVRADEVATVAIAPDALKQVLLGVLQNAREAVPRGLRVQLALTRTPVGLVIEVSDNGPGVPPGLRERIFEPFFTTRSASGGVGLGLSVMEATLRAAGGSIVADEAPGGGACFRITLPEATTGAVLQPALAREAGA